jgi:hypothetical protein
MKSNAFRKEKSSCQFDRIENGFFYDVFEVSGIGTFKRNALFNDVFPLFSKLKSAYAE